MGFLTGAYLKMQTSRMRLQLQNELTSIMSQMNRVTKQIGQAEKMLTSQQRNGDVALRNQMQAALRGAAGNNFDPSNTSSIWNTDSATLQAYSIVQQEAQTRYAEAQSVWADYFENYREAQLEPLKAQEEYLAVRKANIESRLKLIEGQEKAAEEMEKSSQQDFVPQYTGQG